MSFDLSSALRRLKPQRKPQLDRRGDAELDFAEAAASAGPPLLLDTSVYIDALQGRLPEAAKRLMTSRQINHGPVAVAELAHLFGRLDPADPRTRAHLAALHEAIEAIPARRLVPASAQAVISAGIVTGTIARARGLARGDRQPMFNDACLFMQALENGWALLTRNIADMDLIQQMVPAGRVIFYRTSP